MSKKDTKQEPLKTTTLSIIMPISLHDKLVAAAGKNHTHKSTYARQILAKELEG